MRETSDTKIVFRSNLSVPSVEQNSTPRLLEVIQTTRLRREPGNDQIEWPFDVVELLFEVAASMAVCVDPVPGSIEPCMQSQSGSCLSIPDCRC